MAQKAKEEQKEALRIFQMGQKNDFQDFTLDGNNISFKPEKSQMSIIVKTPDSTKTIIVKAKEGKTESKNYKISYIELTGQNGSKRISYSGNEASQITRMQTQDGKTIKRTYKYNTNNSAEEDSPVCQYLETITRGTSAEEQEKEIFIIYDKQVTGYEKQKPDYGLANTINTEQISFEKGSPSNYKWEYKTNDRNILLQEKYIRQYGKYRKKDT